MPRCSSATCPSVPRADREVGFELLNDLTIVVLMGNSMVGHLCKYCFGFNGSSLLFAIKYWCVRGVETYVPSSLL